VSFTFSGPSRAFVDTSLYAALANDADAHHHSALTVVRNLANARTRLVTTNFVAAETHGLVIARAGREAALRVLQSIIGTPEALVRVEADDERRAMQILIQYRDKDFSYTDAISFSVMERLNIRLAATFDRHFAQYGFQVLNAQP
jgi:predicted nucleic acid-binding protein